MDTHFRTRLQAAKWLLDRVAAQPPENRAAYLRSETDDLLLIELVEGLLETKPDGDRADEVLRAQEILNASPASALESGDLLREIQGIPKVLGEFELLAPVGHGGMGCVYLARHQETGRTQAVKVAVAESRECDPIKALVLEAELTTRLRDVESVPRSTPARIIEKDHAVIAFHARDFIQGKGVEDWILHVAPPRERVWQIGLALARSVASCHAREIAHGDLKPSNVLVAASGEDICLIDFGLAIDVSGSTEISRPPVGHAAFAAPETRTGDPFDALLADQFSLGVTLCEMFLVAESGLRIGHRGESRWTAARVRESDLPEPIRHVLERMTAVDPVNRFERVDDVVEALESAMPDERSDRPQARPRRAWAVSLLLTVALVSGFSGWWIETVASPARQGESDSVSSGRLPMALAALEAGDVATAGVLLTEESDDRSWLAGHLRARLRAVYGPVVAGPRTDPEGLPSEDRETVREGSTVSTIDVATGRVLHRWNAEPQWELLRHSPEGIVLSGAGGVLDLDLGRASAATVLADDSVPGSMFRMSPSEVGWIAKDGTIVVHDMTRMEQRRLPGLLDLESDRVAVASNGWDTLVLVDGTSEARLIGVGPRSGFQATVTPSEGGSLRDVVALGPSVFLISGTDGRGWLVSADARTKTLDLEGRIDAIAADTGVVALVTADGVRRFAEVDVSGGVHLREALGVAQDGTLLTAVDDAIAVKGADGRATILRIDPTAGSLGYALPTGTQAVLMADPTTLLIGGAWSGLWVMDAVSGRFEGHLDTGGASVEGLLRLPRSGGIVAQDRAGYIRRLRG